MPTWTEVVVVYALNALWQMAPLALAAWCVTKLMRSARAATIHRVWVACLLVGVVLPVVPLLARSGARMEGKSPSNRVEATGPQSKQSIWEADGPQLDFGAIAAEPARMMPDHGMATTSQVPWKWWCVRATIWMYLACIGIALMRLMWGLGKTLRLRRRAYDESLDENTAEMWEACCASMDVDRVRLLRSVDLSSPATMTLRGAVVLLPVAMRGTSSEEMMAAICHELAHVKRKDFAKNVLYEVVGALLAFHPAAWWVRRRIQESRELACDDMAATAMQDRTSYAGSLLRLAEQMAVGSTARALGVFDGNVMEKRVMNLIEAKVKQAGWRVAISASTSFLVVVVVCAAAARYGVRPVLAKSVKSVQPVMRAMVVMPMEAKSVLHEISAGESGDGASEKPGIAEEDTGTASESGAIETAPALASAEASVDPTAAPDPGQKPAQSSVTYSGTAPQYPNPGDLKTVSFKLGKTYFLPGDSITIEQIHGTSVAVGEHNIYEITGRYTLVSHDAALLAASVTTKGNQPYHGQSPSLNMTVKKGSGEFSVWLFMGEAGDPHVSFYPAEGGSSFAGVYFTTGEGVASETNIKVGDMPRGWGGLAGSKPENYVAGLDSSVNYQGHPSLLMASKMEDTGGFGSIGQYFKANEYAGKRVRLRAALKTKDAAHWAGLWMNVVGVSNSESLSFDNMENRPVKGTTDWKLYDVVLDVPKNAKHISMGTLLDGPGKLWVSEMTLEVVGTDVATTDMVQHHGEAAGPVNLGFEK